MAFIDHPSLTDDGGSVVLADASGHKKTLSKAFASAQGLSWGPDGREVWFTAAEISLRALYSMSSSGTVRLRSRIAGNLTLRDVSREGRMLVTRDTNRTEMLALPPGESKERDLTWLDYSLPTSLSSDGRTVLFTEGGEGGGPGLFRLRSEDRRLTGRAPGRRLRSGPLTGREMGRRDPAPDDGSAACALSDGRRRTEAALQGRHQRIECVLDAGREEDPDHGERAGPRAPALPARRRWREAPRPDARRVQGRSPGFARRRLGRGDGPRSEDLSLSDRGRRADGRFPASMRTTESISSGWMPVPSTSIAGERSPRRSTGSTSPRAAESFGGR